MAHVLFFSSAISTNQTLVNGNLYDIIFNNIDLDSFLPQGVQKFRLEAYLRTNRPTTQNQSVQPRTISVRVNIRPTARVIDQNMVPNTTVAGTITRNYPSANFETTQFGQTRSVIDRPTGVSEIQVTLWDDATNDVLATATSGGALNWVLHLYFYPIEE